MRVSLFVKVKKSVKDFTIIIMSALAVVVMSMGVASAEKQNSVRYGDDYRIFNMEEGATYRQCERRCEKETKCRAWTFIRERVKHNKGLSFNLGNGFSINLGDKHEEIIPAQCRLKHTVGASSRNKCCVSGVVRDMDDNDTAEEDRCARLARRAVKQNDRNLANDCGFRGRLWSASYSRHFDGCIRKGADEARRQQRRRKNELRQCSGGGSPRRNRRCERFADMVLSLNDSNKSNECGFSGSVWSSDFDTHYNLCKRNRNARRDERQIERQRDKIKVCLARGGGAFSQVCDDFANLAIRQQRKNRKNQCGFAGTRWHTNYRRHYQFCRKLSRWRRSREQRSRTRALSRCVSDRDDRRGICESFARDALKDQRKNLNLRCGFTRKTRWHANLGRHIRICEDLSDRERRTEIRVKREALDKCERQNGSGNVKDAFCRDYANVAIDQNRENIKLRCHYTNSLWSDSFRDHYAWCLRSRKTVSRRDRRTRRDKLNECRIEGDVGRGYNWQRKSSDDSHTHKADDLKRQLGKFKDIFGR